MGYALTSIASLPIEPDVELYIFLLRGAGWHGDLIGLVEQNFDNLAREIGPNAVIVKGLIADYFPEEVRERYFGAAHELIWQRGAPGLLITDAHPDTLLPESFRLFVPLDEVRAQFGSFDAFFDSLMRFAKRESDDFIRRFEDARSLVEEGLDIVDLKPNIFGIGLNVNALIRRLRRNGGS